MSIYAISDLHLSLGKPKPMDIFGPIWENHAEKLARNWDGLVKDEDVVLLPGDISWAMRLSEAMADLDFIAKRPGRKILIRGNHDYWWQRKATSRIQRVVNRNMVFLQGNAIMVDGIGITGTRGWRADWELRETGIVHREGKEADIPSDDTPNTQDEGRNEEEEKRILRRELEYLERGIESIPESAELKIVMLHFPPFNERLKPNQFAHMLSAHSIDILVYGHVHLGLGGWLEGMVEGVRYCMVSADVIDFVPQIIVP